MNACICTRAVVRSEDISEKPKGYPTWRRARLLGREAEPGVRLNSGGESPRFSFPPFRVLALKVRFTAVSLSCRKSSHFSACGSLTSGKHMQPRNDDRWGQDAGHFHRAPKFLVRPLV